MDSLGLHHAYDANEVLSNARQAHKHSMTNHLTVMDLMTKAQAKRHVSLVRLQYEQQPDDILVPDECSPSTCIVEAEDGQQDGSHQPLHEGFSHAPAVTSHKHHHRQRLQHQDTSRRPASRSNTLPHSGMASTTTTGTLAPDQPRPTPSLHARCASPAGGLRGSANGALVPSRCASPSLPSAPLPSPPRTPASSTALSPHPPPFAAAARSQLSRNTRMSAPDGLHAHAPAVTAACPDPQDTYSQRHTTHHEEDGALLDPPTCWGDDGGGTDLLIVPSPPSPTHRALLQQASVRPHSSPSPAAAACIHSARTRFISDATCSAATAAAAQSRCPCPPSSPSAAAHQPAAAWHVAADAPSNTQLRRPSTACTLAHSASQSSEDSRLQPWTSGALGSSAHSLSRLGSSTSISGRASVPGGRAAGPLRRASRTVGGYCTDEPGTRARAAAAALAEDSGPHDPLLRDGSKVARELHRLHSCFVEDGDDMVYFAASDGGHGSTCSGASVSGGNAVLAAEEDEGGAQYKQYFHHQLRQQDSMSAGCRRGSGPGSLGVQQGPGSSGEAWSKAAACSYPHVFRPASAVASAVAACSAGGSTLRSLKTMPAALAGPGRAGSPAPDVMRTLHGDECQPRSKVQHYLPTRNHTDSGAERIPQLQGRQLETFPGCSLDSALGHDPDGLLTHGSLCISAAQPRSAAAWAPGPGSPAVPAPPASPAFTPTPHSPVASGATQQCGAATGTALGERCGRRVVLSCPQHPISPQDLEAACRPPQHAPPPGAKRDPAAVATPVSMATWQAMRAQRARDARSTTGQHPQTHPHLHPHPHAATSTSQPCDAGPPSPSTTHSNKQPVVPRLALHQGRDQAASGENFAAVSASTTGAAAGTGAAVATPGQEEGQVSCAPPLGQGHAPPGPRFVRRWGAHPQQPQQHPQQQSPGGVGGGVHEGEAGSLGAAPHWARGAAGPGDEAVAERRAKGTEKHALGEHGALLSGVRRVLGLGRIRAQ